MVPLRRAVTVLTPAFSVMDAGVSSSVTLGVPSSSVIVSVLDAGAAIPAGPVTVAETVVSLSGESMVLFTPVTVTVPVLSLAPSAIVNTRFELRSKSPATAGETAAADTVTRTSSLVS